MKFATLILVLAGTSTSLMAGVFYAFSCAVNLGLGRLADVAYLTGFQSINRAIQNPVFFISFFGAPLFLLLSAWQQYSPSASLRFWLLLAAAVVYLAGALGVTVFGNIPLNTQLESVDLLSASPDELARIRVRFEGPWNRLNTVRTLASTLAVVLLFLACLSREEL
ncbi:anthrone oxygenase family protein [Larkinella humicola]|uniref:DUF1772 domain-containing protein n=1 Tax=Larkinella humicola TaxID=2607654 RepID=A0A5N1J7H3_9BACT|nr:anthrone oxygenase family protein [Larkinella humicola]KAA9346748.1 DUF1772 domain-containing protein [Larkinella humicola]